MSDDARTRPQAGHPPEAPPQPGLLPEEVQSALRAGTVHFMGLEIMVDAGALVPRAETEILARTAIDALDRDGSRRAREAAGPRPLRVIDMCCGSGNLACAIASRVPGSRVWASDLTDGCVAVARRNVEHLGLEDRVTVLQGDLFAPLAGLELEGTVDAVVCNPPYISTGRLAKDRAELLLNEPREAFDGGPYGLSIHQRVVKDALAFLRPEGYLLFEFGLGQDRQLAVLFERSKSYTDVEMKMDGESRPRVVLAKKKAT
jgi:release factor glutamine methyltransferase